MSHPFRAACVLLLTCRASALACSYSSDDNRAAPAGINCVKWVTTRHDGRLVRQLITGDEQGEIKLWDLEGDEEHSGSDQREEH